MIPGDPFETKALDDLRSQQRRLLWVLAHDQDLMRAVGEEQPQEIPQGSPPASREWACRRMAADLLAPYDEYLCAAELEACYLDARSALSRVTGGQWITTAVSSLTSRSLPEANFDRDDNRRRALRDAGLLMRIADIIAATIEQT
jgi:hypothetical protein